VMEGGGRVGEYAGGYGDWARQRARQAPPPPPPSLPSAAAAAPSPAAARRDERRAGERKRRLTFKEQGELAALPDRIDALERERERLYASLADPAVLRDGAAVSAAKSRLAELDTELPALLERWEALETIAAEA
jgi:ABC transport system ATP-binding/permease protein